LRRDFGGPSPDLETAIRHTLHAIAGLLIPAAPADLASVEGEMIDAGTVADIRRGIKTTAEWGNAPSS
jgi:hypothetical protein